MVFGIIYIFGSVELLFFAEKTTYDDSIIDRLASWEL